MRVLLIHNKYQQPGGEDAVFAEEGQLLEQHGHAVSRYTLHNDAVAGRSSLQLARDTIWSRSAYADVFRLVRLHKPEVVHVHNTLPLISPAVYYAAKAGSAAVVQTLHNYRIACPNGLLFRDGHCCEACLSRSVPWPGVIHACYRQSRLASAVVALMLTTHHVLHTWRDRVDAYIAPTRFAKAKMVASGMPAAKIVVKPNFVYPDPGPGDGAGGYAVFVGRLAPEKGLGTLLAAWRLLGSTLPLKIIGDGPLRSEVAAAAAQLQGVTWLGTKAKEEVASVIGAARLLVCPSELYETFGRVVVEAFAKGTPVVASDIGAPAELVENGCTGFHFHAGDPDDLARVVATSIREPGHLAQMRRTAREEFEARYTAEQNYRELMAIYSFVSRDRPDQIWQLNSSASAAATPAGALQKRAEAEQ